MRLQAHAPSGPRSALLVCILSLICAAGHVFAAGSSSTPLPEANSVSAGVSAQAGVSAPAAAGLLAPLKIGLNHAVGEAASMVVTSDGALVISTGIGPISADATDGNAAQSRVESITVIERGQEGATYRIDVENNGLQISSLEGSDERTIGRFPGPITLTGESAEVGDNSAQNVGAGADAGSPAQSLGSAPGGDNSSQSLGVKIAAIGPGGIDNSVWHRYRGSITILRRPDGLLGAINTVNVEDYLYGVLAPEMGGSAPAEALKAQAIASRTYALKNRGRCVAEGFDLDDTTRCQQYEGMDGETSAIAAAVDATRGMVLCYQDALIDAFFSTDCGGITAVDTTGQHPYLQAVVDSPGQGQPDYAMASPYRTWDCRFTQAQLVALLNKDPRTRVGNFVSLSLDSLDASGRIQTATVADANGALKTVTGVELREILGYDTLKSTRVTLTVKSDGDYVFHGMGWGHGFGMSQMGAAAMAAAPYNKSYSDILTHYYVGVTIENVADLASAPEASAPRQ
jgi:stage II sporulation protein D